MTETPDLLALENQVCFALAVASRSVLSLYRPVLEPLGLTHPQYLVMLDLWERGAQPVKEISRALALDPATLSPLLKRLETAGLVSRRRSTADERVLLISPTAEGLALREQAEKIPAQIMAGLEMGFDELTALRGVLHRVIESATPGTLSGDPA